MGLSISVGLLADVSVNNLEMVGPIEAEFATINQVLAEHGLPEHHEPVQLDPWRDPLGIDGFPYSWVHHLRRYYAHRIANPNQIPPLLPPDAKVIKDPVYAQMSSPKSHLLWHSDAEGFYVPVDFSDVIEDSKISGKMLGSSQQLLAELRTLAAPLGFLVQNDEVPPDQIEEVAQSLSDEPPYMIEKATWLILFDAAKYSVQHQAAICFG